MSSPEVSWCPRAANIASAACVRRARRCRRRASRGSAGPGAAIATLIAGERSRDDEPLDLARALEQGVDLGGRRIIKKQEVADVAVPSADLDRLLGDLDRDFARLQLRHRAFGLLELTAAAAFPQRPPDEGAGGLDLRRHVGEHERDRLVLDQRPAELLALLRVMERELERGPCDAQRLGTDDRS